MFSVRGAGNPANQVLERPQVQPQAGGTGPGGPGGGKPPWRPGGWPGSRRRMVMTGAVVALVVLAGAIYAAVQFSGPSAGGPDLTLPNVRVLRLASVTPGTGTSGVNGATPVIVTFNGALASGSPDPVISPSVPGRWTHSGTSAIFTPNIAFDASTTYTVTVPAGIRAKGGARLKAGRVTRFTTGSYSPTRLAQLLSQLGYLPLTWTPGGGPAGRAEIANNSYLNGNPEALAFNPPAGTFTFQSGYPAQLEAMWHAGQPSVMLRGAVMAFQADHGSGLIPTGKVGPELWAQLFKASAAGDVNTNGYSYAIASKGSPETLTIWHNGRQVFHRLANTGLPVAPTVNGTFPVYERFPFQIMRGTNPNGSHYADPVKYVSYFNGGDAVHYFPRPGYGYQQSLGCVELPMDSAKAAYPLLTYGTLVTVQD